MFNLPPLNHNAFFGDDDDMNDWVLRAELAESMRVRAEELSDIPEAESRR